MPKRVSFAAVIVAVVSSICGCGEPRPTASFQPYTTAAFDGASGAGRAVCVLASADWCPSCRELRDTTLCDPTVIAKLNGFTRLKIDYTKRDDATGELLGELNVTALPTLILFNKSGEEVQRFVGTLAARDLTFAAVLAEAR